MLFIPRRSNMTTEVKELFDTLMCNYDFPEEFAAGLAEFLIDEGYGQVDELKRLVADLNNRRHLIWALGVDYDGCNTVKSLKELIDELVSYTQLPEDQIPDITSRTGRWVLESDEEEPNPMFKLVKCSACGDKANHTYKFCPNCGAKMRSDE
jgi:hypothetical protein